MKFPKPILHIACPRHAVNHFSEKIIFWDLCLGYIVDIVSDSFSGQKWIYLLLCYFDLIFHFLFGNIWIFSFY